MDPDEVFRRFFGTSFPEFGHREFSPSDRSRDAWPGEGHHGTDIFDNWHRQMEEMDRQMQEIFRIFSAPDIRPSIPALPDGSKDCEPDPRSKPRDHMLKDGEAPPPSSQSPVEPSKPSLGAFFSPWFEQFTGTPDWKRIPVEEKKDTDLDNEKPNSQEIVDLFERKKQPSPFSFSGSSVNIQTRIGANGRVEERRVVRDSSGREETTVTRKVGDSSHSVTTIRDKEGCEEKLETFCNVDKDKLSEFEKQWQGTRNETVPAAIEPNAVIQSPAPREGILSDTRGFFRKFFGY